MWQQPGQFYNCFPYLTNIYFSKRILSRRKFKIAKNPWIILGILTSIKHKSKLYAMYLKNKCSKKFACYKKYRNKLTHIKENAQQNYFQNVFCGPCSPSDTWKNINQILRKSQLKITKILNAVKVDSKTITDPSQMCNKLNEHFVTVGEKLGFKSNAQKTKITLSISVSDKFLP